ncbi:MAG: sulfatase-like hydrolase/transferase [candidate division Zixibacteria bacterium]
MGWVADCLDLLQIGDHDETIDSDNSGLCCLGVQTRSAGEDSENMKRRDFLQLAVASMTSVFSCGLLASQRKCNVLFISLDDMNDWIGSLGGYSGKVHTPNLDRLVQKGVTFTNAHSPSTVCNPSRTAIMTGLRPSTTGIYHNGHWWRPALPQSVKTWSLRTLREKLIKIGAKVTRHSRYVVFQMAEVAVPRNLFGEILDRIGQLRARPELVRPG